jgi:diguanylate cyclase (GGDEF)-like protein/PAS domain S-box-containing protein
MTWGRSKPAVALQKPGEMKTTFQLNWKVQLAFGSALLIVLIVGAVSYRSILAWGESDQSVQHTHRVLETLQDLLLSVKSIESSARGFVVSGNESYLESLHAQKLRAEEDEALVATMTVDNPTQQNRIPALQMLTAQKIQFSELGISLRREKGLEASADVLRTGWGEQLMLGLQGVVGEMQDEERRLLVIREANVTRRLSQTRTVLLLGTFLSLLIAAIAGWTVQRDNSRRELAEQARHEGEERFRDLANNISQLAWMADATGWIFWYNQRWFDYTGTTLEEMADLGWKKVHHPDHRKRVMDKIIRCFERGEAWEDTFPLRCHDGQYRWFLSRAVPIRNAKGKVLRWFGTNTDITESQTLKDALFAEKERAQVTLNSIGDAVVCTDISGNISFFNQVAELMTGWSHQEAVGRPMPEVLRILDAASREAIPNPMEMVVAQNQTLHLPPNCILIRRDGLETPIEDSVSPIHDRDGRPSGAVIVFRDVSAAVALSLQMTHSARHDFLTGLPNRMLLQDRITQAIALAPRHRKRVAVLFLDLDGFKHINDSLGHAAGDKLLQSIAACLVDCVRGADTVSRQGGDEFVVLLSEVERAEDAAITASRMLRAVAEAHSIDGHDLFVTTSIGVSIYPDDGRDAETLIKNADTAMYQAKESRQQSYQFFKPAMNVRAVERQSIEESLRRALERKEFALHYQPRINLRTGAITGAEALIRWTHPVQGPIPPAKFIPVAEACGLILPIGHWVLREACRQAVAWLEAGLSLSTMAVNISALQFRDEDFLDEIVGVLEETGLQPGFLELELTESVLMKHAESTEATLKILRARGVQLTIDDFGTGYSSLSYLRKFAIDALKIDQSFVRQISTTPDETTIVSAVIAMGRSLKLRVVAEGVETPAELAFLQAHDCDEAQGYYFSRALPSDRFAQLLETGILDGVLRFSPQVVRERASKLHS